MMLRFFSHRVLSRMVLISVGMSVLAASPDALAATRSTPTRAFPEIAAQAFQSLQGHTSVRIGGPTKFPPKIELPKGPQLFLTAQTEAQPTQWKISIFETKHKYPVNPPGLSIHGGAVQWWGLWYWSLIRLAHQPTPSAISGVLERRSGWTVALHPKTSHQTVQVGTAEYGTDATLYPGTGVNWPRTKLMWHSGSWTIELFGSNAISEEMEAYGIADALHFNPLPPHPGLLLVEMVPAPGPHVNFDQTADARGVWIRHRLVYSVSDQSNTLSNATEAIRMIESWHRF